MNAEQIITEHLQAANIMQLATSAHDEPWICTVHFLSDADNNLYWISRNDRNHSKQLAQNSNAAITMVVHENTREENYVIALSFKGKAEVASQDIVNKVGQDYLTKLVKDPQEIAGVLDVSDARQMYIFKPSEIILFDTKNFPETPRQVVNF